MAANTSDELGNLGIAQQINDVLTKRTALLQEHTKILGKQVDVAMKLKELFKSEGFEKITKAVGEASKATTVFTEETEKLEKSQKSATEAIKNSAEEITAFGKAVKATSFALGFLKGGFGIIKAGFSIINDLGKVALTTISNIVSSLYGFATTILSIPFDILKGLIGMANQLPTGPSPIRIELEAIRKAFGDLSSYEGKALSSTLGQFRAEFKDVAGTGLSVSRIFGWGPEGLAKAMSEVREVAEAAGARFNQLIDDFRESATVIAAVNRGLMVNAESMAATLSHAQALGENGSDYLIQITGMAQKMSERFGVATKVIGKGVGEMMKSISDFGALSKKQMVAAATYAAKLGVEIKDLGNVMNKYLNFEDAAVGAAQMAQAFGMNVDALELMKGGPEAIDEMRKAFFASGRSLEQMSTAERKLLEQQTGLQGAALEAAFSAENQAIAYDQVAQAADDAGATQYSQIEVMKKLADSIERFVGSGGRTFESFWDAFKQGFADGVQRAPEFLKMLHNIRRSLATVYWHAREIGRAFVNAFPGVKQFVSSLGALFDPKGISGLMDKLIVNFKEFFSAIGDPNKSGSAVKNFLEGIKKTFKSFFDSKSGAVSGILEGGGKFLTAFKEIFKQVLIYAVEGLTNLFKSINKWLKSPEKTQLGIALQNLWSEAFQMLSEFLDPILTSLTQKLMPQLEKFGNEVIGGIWKFLNENQAIKDIGTFLLDSLKGAIPYIAAGIITLGLGTILMIKLGQYLFGDVKKNMPSLMERLSKAAPEKVTSGDSASWAAKKAKSLNQSMGEAAQSAQSTKVDWKNSAIKFAAMAAFAAAIFYFLPEIAQQFKTAAEILSSVNVMDIVKTGLVLGVLVVTLAGIAAATRLINNIKISPTIIPGLLILGLVLGSLLLLIPTLNMAASDTDPAKMKAASSAISELTAAAIVATGAALAIGAIIMGTVGLGSAAIVVGMSAVGLVLSTLMTILVPVVNDISSMKIDNPEKIKVVSEAIKSILGTSANLAMAVANIMSKIPSGGWFTSAEEDNEAFNRALSSVADLVQKIQEPIKTVMTSMESIISILSKFDPKLLDSATKLIGAIMEPMSSLIEVTNSSIQNFMDAGTNKDSGSIDTGVVRSLAISMTSIMNALTESLGQGLSQAVQQILLIASDPVFSNFSVIEPKLKAVTSIINVLASFSKIIEPFMKMTQLPAGAVQSVSTIMSSFTTVSNALQLSLGQLINSMLALLTGKNGDYLFNLSKPENIARIDMLVKLFDIMTKMSDAISKLSELGKTAAGGFSVGNLKTIVGSVLDLFAWTGDSMMIKIIAAINGINMIPTGVGQNLPANEKNILMLANILNNAVIPLINAGKELPSNIGSFVTQMSIVPAIMATAVGAITSVGSLVSDDKMKTLSKSLQSFSDMISTRLLPTFNIIGKIGPQVEAKVVALSKGLDTLQKLKDQLEGADANIELALDIGKQLSKSGTVTVEIKPATFNFNIHVTMDADKVAEGLKKTNSFKIMNGQ